MLFLLTDFRIDDQEFLIKVLKVLKKFYEFAYIERIAYNTLSRKFFWDDGMFLKNIHYGT